jgi:hypothetical protein
MIRVRIRELLYLSAFVVAFGASTVGTVQPVGAEPPVKSRDKKGRPTGEQPDAARAAPIVSMRDLPLKSNDVVGVALGMSLEQVKHVFANHTPKLVVEEEGMDGPAPFVRARGRADGKDATTHVVAVSFSLAPAARRVVAVHRQVNYDAASSPSSEAVLQAAIDKYGCKQPTKRAPRNGFRFGCGFDKEGAPLTDQAMRDCGELQSAEALNGRCALHFGLAFTPASSSYEGAYLVTSLTDYSTWRSSVQSANDTASAASRAEQKSREDQSARNKPVL